MSTPQPRRARRFIVKKKSFTQQFSHIYNKRLLGLKAAVCKTAIARWRVESHDGGVDDDYYDYNHNRAEGGAGGGTNDHAKVKFVDRMVNMKEGDQWVVIGTTYKVLR